MKECDLWHSYLAMYVLDELDDLHGKALFVSSCINDYF